MNGPIRWNAGPARLFACIALGLLAASVPAHADSCEDVPPAATDAGALEAAAASGQAPAQAQLGYAYWVGNGLPRSDAKARQWLERAARGGSAAAQYWLGRYVIERPKAQQKAREAAIWFRRSADQGCVASLFYLGGLKMAGRGVPKNPAEGFADLLKAAELNDVPAQVMVSSLYATGVGTAKDEKAAFQWIKKAADSGDSKARIILADYYLQGIGTAADPAQAQRLLGAVYDKDDDQRPLAAYYLGWMYMEGKGVRQDDAQAFTWMVVAANAGERDSAARLKTLQQRLPKRKLARACDIHMNPDLSDAAPRSAAAGDALVLLSTIGGAAEAYFVKPPMVGFVPQACLAVEEPS